MIYFLKLDTPHSPILGLRHGMDAEVAKPADIKGRPSCFIKTLFPARDMSQPAVVKAVISQGAPT